MTAAVYRKTRLTGVARIVRTLRRGRRWHSVSEAVKNQPCLRLRDEPGARILTFPHVTPESIETTLKTVEQQK